MRPETASVLSPLIAALVIWVASYVVASSYLDPVVAAAALTIGYPVAVVLAAFTSIYLRYRLLVAGPRGWLLSGAWGGVLAAVVAFSMLGARPVSVMLIVWGIAIGLTYRWLCGVLPVETDPEN